MENLIKEIEELKEENEKLKSRTGLIWKDIPERSLITTQSGEIVYNNYKYKKVGTIIKSSGKRAVALIKDKEVNLTRTASAYVYKTKQRHEYLVNSNIVYIKGHKDICTYAPKLTVKGHSFGFNDKHGDRNNVLIEGDNYHALQILQHTHKDKIDVICIDPPYNTGSRDFKYNDNFVSDEAEDRHSDWLSFMHKRIKLSRNLLTKDGILMMNIDQNESARATLLCKQIFGDDNVDEIVWKKKGGSSNTEKVLGIITETIIVCYVKRKEGALNYRELERKYAHQDEIGKYNLEGIEKTNEGAYKRETMLFTITCPIGNEYYPADGKRWTLSKETVDRLISESKLHFDVKKKKVYRIKRKEDYLESKIPHLNMLEGLGSLKTAKDEVAKLGIPRELFDTPKPIQLIKELLRISAPKNAVVLDFFGGSGTTCHATWDLNKEDNGSRKCILVTNNENNICEDVTYERLRRCNLPEHGDYQEGLEYLKVVHTKQ